MAAILPFPRGGRHGRASRVPATVSGGRAASAVIIEAVIPAWRAMAVAKAADHHSAGILSRCHHLLTADALAPMSDAIASLEGQSSMIARNEVGSDIANPLRHFVLIGKANLSHDCGPPQDHHCGMAKRQGASEYKRRFLLRVAAARVAQKFTQEEMATALDIDQPKYSKYEKRSLLPYHLVEQFCIVCHVSEKWVVTGKGAGPAVDYDKPPERTPRARRKSKKAA